jgi:hypothetical protein
VALLALVVRELPRDADDQRLHARADVALVAFGLLVAPAVASADDRGDRDDPARSWRTVQAAMKSKRVARKTAALTSSCTFKTTITAPRKGSVSITATFAGTASVATVSARAVRVTAG